VLFAVLKDADPLLESAAWVEDRVVSAGLPPERRPFHPHLTLGRFRPGARPLGRELLEIAVARNLGELPVERIVMFQSRLEPSGARYEALDSFPLIGGAA